jgi:hypothetical protein
LFDADGVAELVEEFFSLWGRCRFLFHFLLPWGGESIMNCEGYKVLYSQMTV